jgi:hypothetical protein
MGVLDAKTPLRVPPCYHGKGAKEKKKKKSSQVSDIEWQWGHKVLGMWNCFR